VPPSATALLSRIPLQGAGAGATPMQVCERMSRMLVPATAIHSGECCVRIGQQCNEDLTGVYGLQQLANPAARIAVRWPACTHFARRFAILSAAARASGLMPPCLSTASSSSCRSRASGVALAGCCDGR